MHTYRRRSLLGGALGITAGALAGVLFLVMFSGAASARQGSAQAAGPAVVATHVPPVLTTAGEAVKLRYDIYCVASDDPTAPCDAGGTVYVRSGSLGPYQALTLKLDPTANTGRYFVKVSSDTIAGTNSGGSGLSYYAVLRDNTAGASVTLPAGGAAAPQRIVQMTDPVVVNLGSHAFGSVHSADARVVSAAWGSGPGDVGLEDTGPDGEAIGASAFDVDASGAVTVLDEANERALRFTPGVATPAAVPLGINGTLADMSVGPDGSIYVLESTGTGGAAPLLRTFDAAGAARSAVAIADGRASEVRLGPAGPAVLEYPSSQWMPVGSSSGVSPQAQVDAQVQAGTSARTTPDGSQVLLIQKGDELRVSTDSGNGPRSWVITSSTSMADVQLAQPLGKKRLVVVVRTYTETQDEFVVLVLGGAGIVKQFSLDSADWAETAPLTHFRLVGSSLYQLGTTPAGIFVDRFELGVS